MSDIFHSDIPRVIQYLPCLFSDSQGDDRSLSELLHKISEFHQSICRLDRLSSRLIMRPSLAARFCWHSIISMENSEKSTSKRKKFENEELGNFCDLPELVVSHILSCLPTKDAKTSILSKGWRNLWTTIFNLCFQDFDYDYYLENQEKLKELTEQFTDYVYNVLLSQSTSIEKFTLVLNTYSEYTNIIKWVSAAVDRNVRYLTLRCHGDILCTLCEARPLDVPQQVFHCKSLEALTVCSCLLFNMPNQGFACFPNLKFLTLASVGIRGIPAKENPACFPKLKALCLRHVKFVGKDDCVTSLVRNCPVLENLKISKVIEDKESSNIDFCIPVLKSVELVFCTGSVGRKVEVKARIKSLTIRSWNPTHKVLVRNLDSLTKARIGMSDIKGSSGEILYHLQGEQKDEVFKLIKTVDRVKYLAFRHHAVTMIKASGIKLPLFCNLIQLEVELICADLCVLQSLLHNSNNLRILIIKKFNPYTQCKKDDIGWSMKLPQVPKCLVTSLKMVEFTNFTGCTHHIDTMQHILEHAKVLQRFLLNRSVYYHVSDSSDFSELHRNISEFPRASADCKLSLLI